MALDYVQTALHLAFWATYDAPGTVVYKYYFLCAVFISEFVGWRYQM